MKFTYGYTVNALKTKDTLPGFFNSICIQYSFAFRDEASNIEK